MKLAEILHGPDKGKPKKSTNSEDLESTLDAIIRIEKKRDDAKTELENARQHLEHETARNLDGDGGADIDSAVKGVVAEQARLESLESLLSQAKGKATGLIAGTHAGRKNQLAEAESQLARVRSAIDARRIKTWAEFAKRHGLNFELPTKGRPGSIALPTITIGKEEAQGVADAVVTSLHRDADADKFEKLAADRDRLNVLIRSTPPLALESVLAERRRQK